MNKHIFYTGSGHCPYRNCNASVLIEAAEICLSENPKPEYKNVGFECPHSEECDALDEYGLCPIFLASKFQG